VIIKGNKISKNFKKMKIIVDIFISLVYNVLEGVEFVIYIDNNLGKIIYF